LHIDAFDRDAHDLSVWYDITTSRTCGAPMLSIFQLAHILIGEPPAPSPEYALGILHWTT
jgi:hypothetical protein